MKTNWMAAMACLILIGCDYLGQLRKPENEQEQPIARVHDKYLYKADLTGLVPPRTLPNDSANIVNRYVDAWVRKQLLMKEAVEHIQMDEAEINRRIEDYRYDLIVYAYEKDFIEQHTDTAITEKEIQAYYDENKANFELRQNIVKAVYLKVPKEAPRLAAAKRLLQDRGSIEQIKEVAYNSASTYYLNDTAWVDFDNLITNTPFSEELDNKLNTLRRDKFLETTDSSHVYMIRVYDYKLTSDISPLAFVRERIKDILINKRRVELRRKHENDILDRAEKEQDYEIYKQTSND